MYAQEGIIASAEQKTAIFLPRYSSRSIDLM
ncbi:MAG: hypothetical protein ACJAVY_002563 [Marinoscillum sp.]|jgi:hypothetical protein